MAKTSHYAGAFDFIESPCRRDKVERALRFKYHASKIVVIGLLGALALAVAAVVTIAHADTPAPVCDTATHARFLEILKSSYQPSDWAETTDAAEVADVVATVRKRGFVPLPSVVKSSDPDSDLDQVADAILVLGHDKEEGHMLLLGFDKTGCLVAADDFRSQD